MCIKLKCLALIGAASLLLLLFISYNTLVTEGDHQSGDVQAQLEETEERLEQKMRELEESKERVRAITIALPLLYPSPLFSSSPPIGS